MYVITAAWVYISPMIMVRDTIEEAEKCYKETTADYVTLDYVGKFNAVERLAEKRKGETK